LGETRRPTDPHDTQHKQHKTKQNIHTYIHTYIQVGQLLQGERKERRSKGGNFFSRTAAERGEKSTFNKFKQMVFLLESDFDKFRAAKVGWG